MDKMKRAIHLDFHTMPGIYDFEETFDAAEFAKTLKDAKVEYLNAVAQCNLGFCYYPTNVGIRYPGLKTDLFGSIVKECILPITCTVSSSGGYDGLGSDLGIFFCLCLGT